MLACLLSALVYAAVFPPLQFSWLAWIALVPLFSTLRGSRWQRRLWLGALWGIVSNFAVGFWVPEAIAVYYDRPWWFGPLFCALASLVFWTPYYTALAVLSEPLRRRAPVALRCVVVAALWVCAEVGRATLTTGAPWLPLGYALAPHLWLSQGADLGGVYLLSFVVAAFNAAVSEVVGGALAQRSFPQSSGGNPAHPDHLDARPKTAGMTNVSEVCAPKTFGGADKKQRAVAVWSPLLVAAVLVATLAGYGAWRVAQPLPAVGAAVATRIVQGNNQEGAFWKPGAYGKGFETYVNLSQTKTASTSAPSPRMLIWPEAAVTLFLARDNYHRQRVQSLLRSLHADLLVGAPHYDDTDPAIPRYLNSAYYVTADDGIAARYDKTHLLPFVEYFPLNIDFLRRRFERVRTFIPGNDTTLLSTRFGATAVVICFEAIFPRLVGDLMRRGARVLVVLSNDAWLGKGAGPEQHLAMIRLRAIENRTWVLRSTTTGISAVIDPFGRVLQRTPLFEPAVLDAEVTPLEIETPYERGGDMFAGFCVLFSLGAGGAALRSRLRRETGSPLGSGAGHR
jgi:apolipoprotein N-acyltransferase